jgi:hypothetical protein
MRTILLSFLLILAATGAAQGEKVFVKSPDNGKKKKATPVFTVGPTGLKAKVDTGLVVKVEGAAADSPADGKFNKGQVITGVNGTAFGKVLCQAMKAAAEAIESGERPIPKRDPGTGGAHVKLLPTRKDAVAKWEGKYGTVAPAFPK